MSYIVLIFPDGSGYFYPTWANSCQLHSSSWSTFLGSSCLLLNILIAVQGKWQCTFSTLFFSSELHEITSYLIYSFLPSWIFPVDIILSYRGESGKKHINISEVFEVKYRCAGRCLVTSLLELQNFHGKKNVYSLFV